MTGFVRDKAHMYELLAAGAFGNANPGWTDLAAWAAAVGGRGAGRLWGVRSFRAGDPRTALDVPTAGVPAAVAALAGVGCQISEMVDPYLTFRCEAWDGPGGLTVFGAVGRPELKWRAALAAHGREWAGSAARAVLAHFLNPNSLADLAAVFDRFPGHVVELTALDRCRGTVPGRNAVVWEVRNATGAYEGWAAG